MIGFRIVVLGLLATTLTACGGADSGSQANTTAGAAEEVAPPAHPGEEIYMNYCFSCHTPGLSGAPKLGDAEAWGPRIAKGDALLLQATVEGVPPAMPAKGMCFDCTDEQLADAVSYMVEQAMVEQAMVEQAR